MVRRAGATGRLVRATSPDVILLQELTEEIPASRVERLLESALPGEDWTVHVGRGGGPLRCVVATRLPSAVVTELDPLPQPDRPDREIRTAARLIESPEGRVLAVSVHLKCCGRPGDESDRRRITEARTIRAAMARVIAEEEPDAVVIGGDLNLVGTRTPLEILLGGLDVDGSELTVVDAMQPAPGASNATWYQPDSRFTPGRLDFVLVSDASLQPVRSLVLNGLHMTGPRWTRGGLRPDDTLISDHFPILVDLEWGAR
jgi:endonuclease/exonuclease/phosphatase family metal-dependent hydrolase